MHRIASVLTLIALSACSEPPVDPADTPQRVVCNEREELTPELFVGGGRLPAFSCWTVNQSLRLSGGTFTVEEGVDIVFGTGTSIVVPSGSQLAMLGTGDAQVYLHTGDPLVTWKGIAYEGSQGSDNVWSYVNMENAGDSQWNGSSTSFGALWVESSTTLTLDHVTLSGSPDFAMYVEGAEPVVNIEALSFVNNEKTAWVATPNAHIFPASTQLTDNVDDRIHVGGYNGPNELTADTMWSNVAGGFLILSSAYVSAAWEIMPGTTIQMAEATRIDVEDTGTLIARGEADQPIIFEGGSPGNAGFWTGIQIQSSGLNGPIDVGASLKHVEIRDAGHGPFTGDSESIASLYLRLSGRTEVSDTVISNGLGYGIWATDEHELVNFENNAITTTDVPMRLAPNRVGELSESSVMSGNVDDRIHVGHSNGDEVDAAAEWVDLGVPYLLTHALNVTAPLSIGEGTELQFTQSQYVHVFASGSLSTQGTEDRPIRMVGQNTDVGAYWRGVRFDSRDGGNQLLHTTLLNAGVDPWNGNQDTQAHIFLSSDARLSVINSVISDGAGFAFWMSEGISLNCSNTVLDAFSYDEETDSVVGGC